MIVQEKTQASSSVNDDIDLDELMDDPELEKLHSERIAALQNQGHGEYRDITEGDFLGEVTGSELVICHFYHQEFYLCKIMDKHLKALVPKYLGIIKEEEKDEDEDDYSENAGTCLGFKMDASLSDKVGAKDCSGLPSLQQNMVSAEECDVICCQLNLSLASSPVQLNQKAWSFRYRGGFFML
uniref:Uncharacterized protein n=1 Tax=Chenopodium quinoa TaxID=63459 RepID=A0A803LZI5_CHEQI